MMTRLARERNRSAVAWSLIGIGAWIGAELTVAFGFGIIYALGSIFFGWEQEMTTGWKLLSYVAALAAAIGAVSIVHRILLSKSPTRPDPRASFLTPPPPPPEF
ncbi:MAG: hypothetical protein ACJ741_16660 [Pyrinomonadaceae bacterium]